MDYIIGSCIFTALLLTPGVIADLWGPRVQRWARTRNRT